MDRLTIFRGVDRLARTLDRLGLGPLTRQRTRLLKLIVRGQLLVRVDGFEIRGAIEHRGYLYSLRKGRKEPFMTELFKQAVKPGMLVLDVGAFLGRYTLLAARQVGPRGRVYAFEPDPRSYFLLLQNVRANGLDARVLAVPKAVADRPGTRPFYLHQGDLSRSSLCDARGEVQEAHVESTTVDALLADTPPVGVIKMDIEGAELWALQGMQETLARASPELTVFVECNPAALRASGGSARDLVDRLREFGLSPRAIAEKHRRLVALDAAIETVRWVNLYCTRSG